MLRLTLALLGVLLLAPSAAMAAPIIQFTSEDAKFTTSSGSIVQGIPTSALAPLPLLAGSTITFSFDYNDDECFGGFLCDSVFVTLDGSITISGIDPDTTLPADLLLIDVTTPISLGQVTPSGDGFSIGNQQAGPAGEITVTDGIYAGQFSPTGGILLQFTEPDVSFVNGSVFDNDWEADVNVIIELTPEPSTALLLGTALAGLGAYARRRARRA